ncbi:MAG TPA: beta-ketoacyl-[acyl-carrier-protein] synthase family protein [Nitrospirae bacterium]|nr:beta-ketoacyl-[acyl-carrier-protein] synthase family protein [Nitrospirota bacterium]
MRRVVITGLGVVTSIGIGKEEFWQNLIAGKSGISPVTSFDTSEHFTHLGGEVKGFEKIMNTIDEDSRSRYSRASLLAMIAAKLAVTDSGIDQVEPEGSIGVCYGITTGPIQVIEHINDILLSNGSVSNELACQLPSNSTLAAIGEEVGLTGEGFVLSTACSAGNYAIGYGYDLIRLDRAKIIIASASDAFSRISFTGFNQFKAVAPERCQPFDKNRRGMMVAEGAGVLILEDLEHALQRGANIYAEIVGYGLSCDARHMTSPSIEGIVQCMKKALKEASITPEDIDYISAHGTGTPANDRTECAAIREVFGDRYKEIPVSSIKSMLGHTMGAASAIEAVACTLAIKQGILPPTINYETPDPECDIDCVPNKSRSHEITYALNNSYAFGGNNASVVLKRFDGY